MGNNRAGRMQVVPWNDGGGEGEGHVAVMCERFTFELLWGRGGDDALGGKALVE